jgi:TRAP-type C4-dicarboxylate transport system, periplasmic component
MNVDSNKFNWQVRLAALGIFLLGFVAGALALNAYHVWFGASQPLTREQRYERIFEQLSLSEEQKTEVQKIVAETREDVHNLRKETEPRMKEIRSRTSEKLQKVLTPEQWEKFQKLRNEMKEEQK